MPNFIIIPLPLTDTVKLLGIKNDKDVTFDTNIVKLCSKGAAQLSTVSKLNRYLGQSEKTASINSFI